MNNAVNEAQKLENYDPAEWSWRSERYAWWVVIVLILGLTLSIVDRMIMALMIEPIKHDLGLSDTQVSLIHGLAFTILYITIGLPLGRLADFWNRRNLAAISVVTWSVMTGLCGMASSFGQLFVARMGVGVGEAGLSPSAVSIISDYFPKHKRGRPLTWLSIGATAGGGLAMIFGGAIVYAIGTDGLITLPIFGEVYSWQAVFLMLGVFGVFYAFIFMTVREPIRREVTSGKQSSVGDVVKFITDRKKFFFFYFLGVTFAVMVNISFHTWAPSFFIRSFGWNAGQTGLVYGVCITVAGISGLLAAGWIVDRLASKGVRDGHLRIAVLAPLGAVIPLVMAPMMQTPALSVVLIFVGQFLNTLPAALAPVVLQEICPNQYRGQIFAFYLFVLSLLAYAVAPLIVALFTDYLFVDEAKLYLSLSLFSLIFVPMACIFLWVARREFNKKALWKLDEMTD